MSLWVVTCVLAAVNIVKAYLITDTLKKTFGSCLSNDLNYLTARPGLSKYDAAGFANSQGVHSLDHHCHHDVTTTHITI